MKTKLVLASMAIALLISGFVAAAYLGTAGVTEDVWGDGASANGSIHDSSYDEAEVDVSNGVSPRNPPDGPSTREAATDGYTREFEPGNEWFVDVASREGLTFEGDEGRLTTGSLTAGVFVSDYDRDGDPDVLTANASRVVLHENEGDRFRRSRDLPVLDMTISGAMFFDYDNDGWEDLLLLRRYDQNGSAVFFENEGGVFERESVGLERNFSAPRTPSAADYTGNGCLDVFVSQEGDWDDTHPAGHEDLYVSHHEDNGFRNRLFRGNCSSFVETTSAANISGTAWSLSSSFLDFTGDGLPDIHVANDYNEDVLYVNEGDGTFTRKVLSNATNRNGMSSEVADVNDDALPDLFVTNIYRDGNLNGAYLYRVGRREEGNNLLINKGGGRFVDVAEEYGVRRGGFGWAAVVEDLSADGNLEVLHTTTSTKQEPQPVSFWTLDDGGRRHNATEAGFWPNPSLGLATLDFDGDGSIDLVESSLNGPFRLYDNRALEGSWLKVELEGGENQTPIGSRVTVVHDGGREVGFYTSRTDYMSQGSRILYFGLGQASHVREVVVELPDGSVVERRDVDVNQTVVVHVSG